MLMDLGGEKGGGDLCKCGVSQSQGNCTLIFFFSLRICLVGVYLLVRWLSRNSFFQSVFPGNLNHKCQFHPDLLRFLALFLWGWGGGSFLAFSWPFSLIPCLASAFFLRSQGFWGLNKKNPCASFFSCFSRERARRKKEKKKKTKKKKKKTKTKKKKKKKKKKEEEQEEKERKEERKRKYEEER